MNTAPLGHGRTSEGILGAIGNTPLVRLRRFLPSSRVEVYAKLEAVNPGGSAKDRPAAEMLRDAIRTGLVRPGGLVIESSSGNMAIGLAQACACLDLRLLCVIDPKTSPQMTAIIQALGARTHLVKDPDADSGEYLPARIRCVKDLLKQYPGAFWTNQYANTKNAEAHHRTMAEIAAALGKGPDMLLCPVSTCGTLRGCAEFAIDHDLPTKVFAVDAYGSAIFGARKCKRLMPGHGSALRPALADKLKCAGVVYVSDSDCIAACRRLAATEGILVGASGGGALMALARMHARMRPGSACVAILHDRGERYMHSVFSDEWVKRNIGDIPDFERLSQEDANVTEPPRAD